MKKKKEIFLLLTLHFLVNIIEVNRINLINVFLTYPMYNFLMQFVSIFIYMFSTIKSHKIYSFSPFLGLHIHITIGSPLHFTPFAFVTHSFHLEKLVGKRIMFCAQPFYSVECSCDAHLSKLVCYGYGLHLNGKYLRCNFYLPFLIMFSYNLLVISSSPIAY